MKMYFTREEISFDLHESLQKVWLWTDWPWQLESELLVLKMGKNWTSSVIMTSMHPIF